MRGASADASMHVPAAAPASATATAAKVAGATVALAALAVCALAASGTAGHLQSPVSSLGAWGAPAEPNPFNTFAPQCEPDLRHNSCGAMGELCQCLDLQPGLVEISSRALKSVLDKANVFILGDSTSKMMVHHACRTLIDPAADPQGAGCFKEDGMPTVYSAPEPPPTLPEPGAHTARREVLLGRAVLHDDARVDGELDVRPVRLRQRELRRHRLRAHGVVVQGRVRHAVRVPARAQNLPFTFQERATEALRRSRRAYPSPTSAAR